MTSIFSGLDDSQIFSGMTSSEINTLESIFTQKEIAEGKTVFIENMLGESLYLIKQGTIRISKMLAEGDEEILVVLGQADIFGEMAIFDNSPRSATARVAEDVVLFCLSKTDFDSLSKNEPTLCLKLATNIIRLFNASIRASHLTYREMLLDALNRRN